MPWLSPGADVSVAGATIPQRGIAATKKKLTAEPLGSQRKWTPDIPRVRVRIGLLCGLCASAVKEFFASGKEVAHL
jgi:hypothetical protein